ncbi:EamA family transporter [Cetobacterium somerae]|uniref:DMT family transporter n=1 Tax=Cetobacterium somerae TaxID=188913 RepID=UPI00211E0363|nr:DMT family transporter [Cetobacterium somerae]MCQ9627913.1 EamA family transporter [Cetobacterium somerae]
MHNLGYFLSISAGLIWGTIGLSAMKLNELGLNPYEISFVRTLFAFVLGLIFIRIKNKVLIKNEKKIKNKKIYLFIIVSGILCQGLLNIFYSKSVIHVGTITGIMLLATGPIFTIIFSKIFFKESLGFFKILALTITFVGAFLLITEGNIQQLNFNFQGVIYGVLSGVCYGMFPIINKKIIDQFNPVEATIYSFGVASFFLLAFIDQGSIIKILNSEVFKAGLFYGLFPTLIAYILYSKSMVYIPATSASIISLLEVPATALIGVLFLNESLGKIKILGMLIILTGIVCTKITKREKKLI